MMIPLPVEIPECFKSATHPFTTQATIAITDRLSRNNLRLCDVPANPTSA
jgi:hypothetical protein